MNWVVGTDLPHDIKQQVLRSYVYRMTVDAVATCPQQAQCKTQGGYRMPIITDAEWLADALFPITSKGKLARNRRFRKLSWGTPEQARENQGRPSVLPELSEPKI